MRPFDEILSGTGLYVTALATALFASLMSLPGLRPRSGWLAALIGLGAILTPQLLIYPGIVWRDVAFAALTVAGFVLIAHAARRWAGRGRLVLLAGAAVCLAVAALERQNGLILVVAAAAVVGWSARSRGGWALLAWGIGFLAAVALLAAAFDHLAQPRATVPGLRQGAGLLILEHYDVVGAAAQDPGLRLQSIRRAAPDSAALIERRAAKDYSPERVDTLDADPALRQVLWHVPDAAMNAQWREILLHHTGDYLRHRAAAFRWVFLTPDVGRCLPVVVGVDGAPAMLQALGMTQRRDHRDDAVAAWAQRFYGTPVYSHLAWAFAALGTIGLLLLRRDPADWAIIGLLAGGLAFAASFAVISLACDYRYLYLVDLSAITGLLYLALDLPGRRRA